MLTCKEEKKWRKDVNTRMITAHSGCDGTPDNSLEFVHYALEHDADCLEVDVRKNGKQLYISHDGEEGCERIDLGKVFRMLRFKDHIKINCDLKESNLEEAVYKLAQEERVTDRLIYTGSVNPEKFRKENPDRLPVTVYLNIENISLFFNRLYRMGSLDPAQDELEVLSELIQACEKLEAYAVKGINICYAACTEEMLDYMQNRGVGISLWTVKEPEKIMEYLRRGVDNITTRNLEQALEQRKQWQRA